MTYPICGYYQSFIYVDDGPITMTLQLKSCSRSHPGLVRDNNEDAFLGDDELGLWVVADGMGGHAAGEVASAEAIDQIFGMIRRGEEDLRRFEREPSEESRTAIHRLLESAVQAATYFVFSMTEVQPDQRGMGTTISLLAAVGETAFVAQVGDSRVYRQRKKTLIQLTEDHTLVNLKLKKGELTPEQAKEVDYGHVITRAVGVRDYVDVDTFDVGLKRGDRFLLCSDGLHDYAEAPEDLADMLLPSDLDEVAEALVNFALTRGGKDNITIVLIDCL